MQLGRSHIWRVQSVIPVAGDSFSVALACPIRAGRRYGRCCRLAGRSPRMLLGCLPSSRAPYLRGKSLRHLGRGLCHARQSLAFCIHRSSSGRRGFRRCPLRRQKPRPRHG